jgi:AraC-like DNA-binding protein
MMIKYLYKTCMEYFDGVQWIMADHQPRCSVWLKGWSSEYYALNFARAGRIRWATGRRRPVELAAPVAWWTWPGETFSYGCSPGESWNHAYVTFSGPRVRRWVAAGLLPTDPARGYVMIQEAGMFANRMDELVRRFRDPVRRTDWMTALLESLLVLCAEERRPGPGTLNEAELGRIADDIQAHPARERDWNAVARSAAMSPSHFRRVFRAFTGLAPNQYQIHIRMREAADQLRRSAVPIKQIAADVGYDNVYYFTKLFKDRFGLPPGRYRAASALMVR